MKYEVLGQGGLLKIRDWVRLFSAGAFAIAFFLASAQANGPDSGNSRKVTVCHKGHAIQIDEHALKAHLAHGDTEGPCEITPSKNK